MSQQTPIRTHDLASHLKICKMQKLQGKNVKNTQLKHTIHRNEKMRNSFDFILQCKAIPQFFLVNSACLTPDSGKKGSLLKIVHYSGSNRNFLNGQTGLTYKAILANSTLTV